jgi:hypothetical protein
MINHGDIVEPVAPVAEQPLPPGWEGKIFNRFCRYLEFSFFSIERKDGAGRTYYVDHSSRATTWTRPTGRK